MAKLPWFPFYPSDFLGAEKVQLMTNEQVGMYVKLLCYQWMEGSIPEKSSSAIAVLRLGWGDASEMADFQNVLETCFVKHPTEKGRLINKRLDAIRCEQEELSLKKQEAGRAGGHAKARLAVLGSCQVSATGKRLAKSSYSESKSKSESKSESEERIKSSVSAVPAKSAPKTEGVWESYRSAYELRYGAPPIRNASVNGILSRLVDRLGVDVAPAVATFYVQHNNPFYVGKRHPVSLLLADAEGLHTQWVTGVKATTGEAKNAERRDDAQAQIARVKAAMGEV